MKNMIETKNLTKTYKEFIAVDHVSLHIKKGSIYGFLGPNGIVAQLSRQKSKIFIMN